MGVERTTTAVWTRQKGRSALTSKNGDCQGEIDAAVDREVKKLRQLPRN